MSPPDHALAIADAMEHAGIDFVASFPDTQISSLIRHLQTDHRFTHVVTSREDEAIGVAVGAYFGGRHPCVLIQNSGLLEALNDILVAAVAPEIPMLLLVGYRGHFSETGWYHGAAGRVTEHALELIDIKYAILDDIRDADAVLKSAQLLARVTSRPTAVLLTLSALEPES